MYPYLRAFYHQFRAKQKSELNHPFEESAINMRVWPWDIDMFMELNNGRYLTLMDIGRFELGERMGLFKALKKNQWGLMVGAVSTRYRRRLRPFQKFKLRTKILYFDDRWFYFRQWFVTASGAHASFLVRTAVVSKGGLVPTSNVVKAMGIDEQELHKKNIKLDWIAQWEASDEIHKKIMEDSLK